jgi:[ribosomal protein S5]-alanine N-acetyltransferase
MMEALETERLILRPLMLEDAARTQEIFPYWEIVKYLNAIVPWPYPEGGALAFYRDMALPAIARGEQWVWTLRLKECPEEHIGSIHLRRGENNNRGFWIGLPWQGRGLMTEAVVAANEYWFDVLGMSVLRAPKAVENVGSRRISEKTGMRIVGTEMRDYVSGRLLSEIWEITAEEWREWKAR